MDEQTITHLGIGGLFALAILKVVFDFLKNKNCSVPISKTEFDKHKESVQYKDNCTEIVKRMDGRFDNIDNQLSEVKDLIKNGH